MKSFEQLVLAHLKNITGPLLDPLQFANKASGVTWVVSWSLLIICGNLLVIISIIYFKQLHTPTNYLILSLAVADLLIGALMFPFNMALSLTTCLYRNTLKCLIQKTFDFTISSSSILNLCCISIDRYYAVCHPLIYKTKLTDHVSMMMGLGSWAVSVLFGILYFVIESSYDFCNIECFALIGILGFLTFYVPTIILFCVYSKILLVALKQVSSLQNASSQSGPVASKKERKATKTMAIVMGLFMICWLPIFIAYPFRPLSNIVVDLFVPFNWFALSNSMFNPFIYAFFYRWFRSAFRMIISGKIFQVDFANTNLH
ncbi:trace amine-associated receptor 1-like [Mugil cephalus]|uniref:trace amine-associated receptor 1-like n=1 Tax=Mugil cephalus TaxID=48193 RepID=UPI001FB6E1D9|nr:trace amine-associated receptor 1-like [Mugil cephalus]